MWVFGRFSGNEIRHVNGKRDPQKGDTIFFFRKGTSVASWSYGNKPMCVNGGFSMQPRNHGTHTRESSSEKPSEREKEKRGGISGRSSKGSKKDVVVETKNTKTAAAAAAPHIYAGILSCCDEGLVDGAMPPHQGDCDYHPPR
jgi:hypothetical protein